MPELRDEHDIPGQSAAGAVGQLLERPQPEDELKDARKAKGEDGVSDERINHPSLVSRLLLEHVNLRKHGHGLEVHAQRPAHVGRKDGLVSVQVRLDKDGKHDARDEQVGGAIHGLDVKVAKLVVALVVRAAQRTKDAIDEQ